LRQTVEHVSAPSPTPFAGSPSTVADQVQRWFEGRAVDGLNYHIGHPGQWRRVLDEGVPILRGRGIVRSESSASTLRGNLGLPVPENRYTRAGRERGGAAQDSAIPGTAGPGTTELAGRS